LLGRVHFHTSPQIIAACKSLAVPVVGLVASWDHPTTKGPTPPGICQFLVQSRRMLSEMIHLHGISKENIFQIGKLQMDYFKHTDMLYNRQELFQRYHIPLDHRLIVFGPNTTGLKEHEVSIANFLAMKFRSGTFGKASLFIRTHPQDIDWKRDFLTLQKYPYIICRKAFSFGTHGEQGLEEGFQDQKLLASLMQHADVVIQSRGSLALDAAAFDTPIISLAYDGEQKRNYNDSFLREYEFEHYKPIVDTNGTYMVGSHVALERAIHDYLKTPDLHAPGRRKIREEHIEPLDGKAAVRLVEFLLTSAQKAREGTLPETNFNYQGLGDKSWWKRQYCDVKSHVAV
jgi:CDP-glycerol glycerophosphotransferase (TagB/SpsB family)